MRALLVVVPILLSSVPYTMSLAPQARPSISFGVLPNLGGGNVLPFTLAPPKEAESPPSVEEEEDVTEKQQRQFPPLFGRSGGGWSWNNSTDSDTSAEHFSLPKKRQAGQRQARRSPVTVISSGDEFLDYLKSDSRLVVVKFHAQWCSACKRFDFKYQKLAADNVDTFDEKGNLMSASPVRFADVEYSKNRKLCKVLGVDRLPCVQMYREGEGRLCSFACDPSKFNTVVDRINHYLRETEKKNERNSPVCQ